MKMNIPGSTTSKASGNFLKYCRNSWRTKPTLLPATKKSTQLFLEDPIEKQHNWQGSGLTSVFSPRLINFQKDWNNLSSISPLTDHFRQYCVFWGLTFLALGLNLLKTYQSFDRKFYSPSLNTELVSEEIVRLNVL